MSGGSARAIEESARCVYRDDPIVAGQNAVEAAPKRRCASKEFLLRPADGDKPADGDMIESQRIRVVARDRRRVVAHVFAAKARRLTQAGGEAAHDFGEANLESGHGVRDREER